MTGSPVTGGSVAGGPVSGAPVLLAVAHGSRDPRAAQTMARLVRRVVALRPGLVATLAFVELSEPLLDRALADLTGPPVVVPLLLGAGHHTRVDIAGRVPAGTTVAPALGPHPLLAYALLDRVREAGWRPGEPIVLAGAGSTEPESVAAAHSTARLLAATAGSPVHAAFLGTCEPSLPEALARLGHDPHDPFDAGDPYRTPVTVAPYLLAPGRFATTAATVAAAAGARVAQPLGVHDALARLVLRRFDEARHGAALGRLAYVIG